MHYAVTGQFADDGTFIVNAHTGEVYVTRPLDRDAPRGRPVWNFNVLAHDEAVDAGGVGGGPLQPSLTGYAEVRVVLRDLNDNAPVFDRHRLVGKVTEHSRAGEYHTHRVTICLCRLAASFRTTERRRMPVVGESVTYKFAHSG